MSDSQDKSRPTTQLPTPPCTPRQAPQCPPPFTPPRPYPHITANKIIEKQMEVLQQRGKERDCAETGERSMLHTVKIFESITGIKLTEHQGWTFMMALKLARMQANNQNPDDYLDLANYAALTGESANIFKEF